MDGKNLTQKLKIGLVRLGLISLLYFNPFNATAQENYKPKYNNEIYSIINEVHKENNFISPKILDRANDLSKEIITKPAKDYSEQEAKGLMKKIDSLIFKQNPNLNDEYLNYNKCLIYLAIAEENNLPLYPVLMPGHVFVRWDSNNKHNSFESEDHINKGDFNLDLSTLKTVEDDAFLSYLFHHKVICFEALTKGVYLKNLDKKELLAVAYWQEALVLNKMKRYGEAMEYANKSIKKNPDYPRAYQIRGNCFTNLGDILQKKEFYEYAIEDYNKAQKLYIDSENYYGMGFNLYRLEKYDEAEENYNQALHIKDEPKYFFGRYQLYTKTNQKEKAERDSIKIKSLLKEGD